MRYIKFSLSIALFLVSCTVTAIDSPTPTIAATSTFPSPSETPKVPGTPTLTVTPDAALGTVEGHFLWSQSNASETPPIPEVTVQLDRHNGDYLKYKVKTEADGHFVFANIEPGEYGFGIYMNLQLSERKCDAPEYVYSRDLGWQHYASWLKVDVFYDIIFSSTDITIKPGEPVVLDFVLKCE